MKLKASKAKKPVQEKKEVKKTKTTKQVAKAKENKKSSVKVSSKVVTTTVTTKTNGKTNKKVTKKVVKTVTTPNTPTQTAKSTTTDTKIVKGISKNNAVVDPKFPNSQNYYVVSDSKGDYNNVAFDCTMNQSDLKNNNNKFYIIQMISPESNPNQYIVWNRWGRVGYDGQTASFPFNDYNQAKDTFLKKYKDKTKNGYTALVMDYSNNNVDTSVKTAKKVKKVIKESKLPQSIQNLMNLIYDTQIMNKQMAEIGYDAKKMPLGKLGKETITAGYKVLKNIENVLKKKEKGDLKDLSSEFYTLIPHDFGFRHMSNFVIDTVEKLKEKVSMVESLSQIEVATKILDDAKNAEDIVDQYYKKLECEIEQIDSNGKDFKILHQFLENSKLSNRAIIEEAFVVKRKGEHQKFKDLDNKLLLWHGSRITNFVGILSQGLRIAPPEAPVSGYRFGKGCYFADMSSKSLGYCYPSGNTALILLCEVAVGNPNVVKNSDSSFCLANLPKGKHSTKYLGSTFPPEESYITHENVKIPIGKPSNVNGWDFNEYIVYDTNQVKLKYLLKLKV